MNLVHKIENWGDTHHPVVLGCCAYCARHFFVYEGYGLYGKYSRSAGVSSRRRIPSFSRHQQLWRWCIMLRLPTW